ncbi:hypothetical protein D3C84_1286180 [compost metagenome]
MRGLKFALVKVCLAAGYFRIQGAAAQQRLSQPDPAHHDTAKYIQVRRSIGQAEVGVVCHLSLQA